MSRIAAALTCMLLLTTGNVFADEKLEYRLVVLEETKGLFSNKKVYAKVEASLNDMAKSGWRLISTQTVPEQHTIVFILFFERGGPSRTGVTTATPSIAPVIPAMSSAREEAGDDEPDPIPTQRAHVPDASGKTFIRTQSAGHQEVVVGRKVKVTRTDGKIAIGTIVEVSDVAIVIDVNGQRVHVDASDIAQITKSN